MNAYEQDCWDRFEEWCDLIPGYVGADKNKKKRLKKEYKMANLGFAQSCLAKCIVLDDRIKQSPMPCTAKANAPRKGNDNMYVEQNMTVKEKTTEDVRREHFLVQLDAIYCKKDAELREKFGISVKKAPKTPKELVEWIKSGEYTFTKGYDPEDEDTWDTWEIPYYGIRWTKVKEDRKGYDEAYKALHLELNEFRNECWAEVEPANFLKILEKFKKSKLH
jgi:hypothetical protein